MEPEPSPAVIEKAKPENIIKEIQTEGVTPIHDVGGGYVEFDRKLFQAQALKELRPDLFSIRADSTLQASSNFGTSFPISAKKGDVFVRVDVLPNRVYKFDGLRWIEINKNNTTTYLDAKYIEYLIGKINSGEIDLDHLSDNEKLEMEAYLKGNQNT